jgi:flagellar hook-basal body complex protein FliE
MNLTQAVQALQDANKTLQAATTEQTDVSTGTDQQAITDAATTVKDATAEYNDCLNDVLTFNLSAAEPVAAN